jgi:hypothetical protein
VRAHRRREPPQEGSEADGTDQVERTGTSGMGAVLQRLEERRQVADMIGVVVGNEDMG